MVNHYSDAACGCFMLENIRVKFFKLFLSEQQYYMEFRSDMAFKLIKNAKLTLVSSVA